MRKIILVIIVVLAIITFLAREDEEKEIRVRIIPNSQSQSDLEVKNQIKGIVLSYLDIVYDSNYNECYANIKNTYKDLEYTLNNEFDDIDVSFEKHTLYNKTYNDNAVKNTEAYTLYVVIGQGKGSNWWGSVYPKFLSVEGDTEISYESLLVNIIKKIKEK